MELTDDMLVDNARRLAERVHRGQTDKAGRPYVEHLERVALAVAGHSVSPALLQAVAWLHDSVEDAGISEQDLVTAGMPPEVVDAICAITHIPNEPRLAYYARVKANNLARLVKLADVADNSDPARLALLDETTRRRLAKKYELAQEVLSMRPSYVEGDATDPTGDGPKIIAHVCNNIGRWASGFVVAVSRRWPGPEMRYREWWKHRTGAYLPLGKVQLWEVERDLWVANMVAQHGIGTARSVVPPIRYDALAECLREVGKSAVDIGASVHMPRIGCGLAGGSWDRVEPLIVQELCERGIPVTVYDLPDERATSQ